jgi:nuclear migration protein JNM1
LRGFEIDSNGHRNELKAPQISPLTQSNTPILPTLSHLSSKLNLLTSSSQIDALSIRIKSLISELTSLEEKRDQVRQRALLDPEDVLPISDQDPQSHKIDALYSVLGTIDRIAPVVPGILDRLRTMRTVHADAANVTFGLNDVGSRLKRMEGEVKEWEEAVERVESSLKEVAERVGGTAERLELVVSELEGRISNLGL